MKKMLERKLVYPKTIDNDPFISAISKCIDDIDDILKKLVEQFKSDDNMSGGDIGNALVSIVTTVYAKTMANIAYSAIPYSAKDQFINDITNEVKPAVMEAFNRMKDDNDLTKKSMN